MEGWAGRLDLRVIQILVEVLMHALRIKYTHVCDRQTGQTILYTPSTAAFASPAALHNSCDVEKRYENPLHQGTFVSDAH